ETFHSPNRGPAGLINTGKIAWFDKSQQKHTTNSEFAVDNMNKLPRVDIIYAHANMSPSLIKAAVDSGAKGLVIAGVGDGNMTQPALDALTAVPKNRIVLAPTTPLPTPLALP